jgi:N-acetyltransferase
MGIPRVFVPSAFRRHGIALRLLDAAAATFVHGCPLSPRRGEVAFTQPTASGKALMEKWGGGGVRIYQE